MSDIAFLVSPKLPVLSSAPSSPSQGDSYYDSVLGRVRVYNGSSWDNLTPVSNYTVTTANADNTTSNTHVFSITVPANSWADGDTIYFTAIAESLQNQGGAVNLTFGGSYNGNSVQATATSIANSATQAHVAVLCSVTRIGTSLYFYRGTFADLETAVSADQFSGVRGAILTGQTFTADATLTIDLQWGTANANTYWRVLGAARAWKGPAGSTAATTSSVITVGGEADAPAASTNRMVWVAPYACTVTAVKGFRNGGTGATVNARKNGSSTFLSSNLSLTSADTVMDGGSVQNSSLSAGDYIELMWVTVSGSPTYVSIQVNITRT